VAERPRPACRGSCVAARTVCHQHPARNRRPLFEAARRQQRCCGSAWRRPVGCRALKLTEYRSSWAGAGDDRRRSGGAGASRRRPPAADNQARRRERRRPAPVTECDSVLGPTSRGCRLGASWIAGVAAVWLLHIGQFGSCDVRGAGGRASEGLWRAGRGQRLAAGGGSASSGSLTQAEKTGSPCQPLGAGVGVMVPGVVEGGGDHGERDARSVRLATRLLAGLRAKPPGIAAGSGLVLYFCVAVIMHVRAGAFRVIRVPAAYLGLSSMSFALATRRATRPPTA
jgi:hypothetical protein